MNDQEQVFEIDILEVVKVLWENAVKIIIWAIIFGLVAFGVTYYFITPMFSSDCMFYVNNSTFSVGSSSISLSSADISASKSLVDTYLVILKSRSTLNDVIENAGLDMDYKQLSNLISSGAVNNTEVFKVTVTTTDPEESRLIANTIAKVLPNKVSSIIEGSSVRIVDYAVLPTQRTSPSFTKNTAIGLLAGGLLSALIIVVRHLFDDVVRSEEFLTSSFDIPMLAIIPDLYAGKGKGYYKKYKKYGYAYKSKYGYYKNNYGNNYGYGKKPLKTEVDFNLNKQEGGEDNGSK